MSAASTPGHGSIAQVLRATHRPDVGIYGACVRCQHGAPDGQACNHPAAGPRGTSSAHMRSSQGPCGDGHLQEYRAPAHHHPQQITLAL